jgi:diacylglycerol O-acyltransferase / wax synthase
MMQQLSAQDAQFLYIQSPSTLTHVMAAYIFDPATAPGGKVRFKDIVRHVESRLHTSPVFKRKLFRLPFDFDHPYWVEDKAFELESHISHVRLPEPGDWRQFCIQVARHFSRPMDMSRPLWDMYVVEGLDRIEGVAPGSYAILTRIHHAAIDGASAAHFFVGLSDIDANGTPIIKIAEDGFELGEEPSNAEIMARAISANLTSPVKFLNTLMKMSPAILSEAQKSLSDGKLAEQGVPKTRFNATLSPHKMFDGTDFALADLSMIRKKVDGATINDVVLAVCSGALRRYLQHHKELPKKSLVAVAPVNLRTKSNEAEAPGNNISAMSVELATHIADPLKRLSTIRDYTRDAKEAKTGLSARVMTDLSKHIPGATMAGVARLLTSPRFAPTATNVFISNVPGPQFPLYMNGAKLTGQFGMAPLAHNMGLFIATPSYNGRMSFCVTSERSIMPDIAFFRECIEASVAELMAATPGKVEATKKVDKPKARVATSPNRMVKPRRDILPKAGKAGAEDEQKAPLKADKMKRGAPTKKGQTAKRGGD